MHCAQALIKIFSSSELTGENILVGRSYLMRKYKERNSYTASMMSSAELRFRRLLGDEAKNGYTTNFDAVVCVCVSVKETHCARIYSYIRSFIIIIEELPRGSPVVATR